MINMSEAPKLDETLKVLTPWWDVLAKYLLAAMMAIALTSIAIQVSQDKVICIPAIDCSGRAVVQNGSSTVNASDDTNKICQSLEPRSLNKKVFTKMVDRRFYDYVDSVCFQELSWFTKFFPFIIFGETVLLLVCDILWTKLPYFSSVLNHFVALADEAYRSSGTVDNILEVSQTDSDEIGDMEATQSSKQTQTDENKSGDEETQPSEQTQTDENEIVVEKATQSSELENRRNKRPYIVPEADFIKVKTLCEKAYHFKEKYVESTTLRFWYICRAVIQLTVCIAFIIILLVDAKNFFSIDNTVRFNCNLEELVFAKEYDQFECSHPMAPFFRIAIIFFLISLCVYLGTSLCALYITWNYGKSYTLPDIKNNQDGDETVYCDFAFLFFLLGKHDELYAGRVSYFFRSTTMEGLKDKTGNIHVWIDKRQLQSTNFKHEHKT